MSGTDKVRACAGCDREVYNLSAMSRAEAEQLLNCAEKRLCVAVNRGPDGQIITTDRPGRVKHPFAAVPLATLAAFVGVSHLSVVLNAGARVGQQPAAAPMDPVSIEKRPSTGSLSGTVTETNGERYPGVHVSVRNENTGEYFVTETDENGRYHLRVPTGRYFVDMSLAGYCQLDGVRVRSRIAQQLDVQLRGTLVGEVVYSKPCGTAAPSNLFIKVLRGPFVLLKKWFDR